MVQFIKAKAAWIEGNRLAHDVVLCVEDATIVDVVAERQIVLDPTSVAICEEDLVLPGFIDAHAHLEYSFCRGQLPRGRVDFADWIEAIGALKRNATPEEIVEKARAGVQELIRGGCTTVIDCAHRPEMSRVLAESPIRHAILWELIALDEERARAVWQETLERLQQPRPQRCLAYGLNPHAPYSVGPHLRTLLREWLADHANVPVGWHIGETDSEAEFFLTGRGSFQEFCERHSLPKAFDEPPGCSPYEFLEREGLAASVHYAFHLNVFSRREARQFRAPRAVVHCPTTHEFFDRPPFPLFELIREGANICLGTDSLASADTLDMFEVLRLAGRMYPSLTGPQLLDLVTKNPARTLVWAANAPRLGVLERGAACDLVALRTSCSLSADLREILLHPDTRISATYIAGQKMC